MPVGPPEWPGAGPLPFPKLSPPMVRSITGTNLPREAVNGTRTLRVQPLVGTVDGPFTKPGIVTGGDTEVLGVHPTKQGNTLTLSGTVLDQNSNPVATTVRAYDRVSGFKIGETQSSAIDGSWTIKARGCVLTDVVAFDSGFNALIFDQVVPL